jgi:uncharacterized membrane protein
MSVTHSLDGSSLPVQSGAAAQTGQAARRRVNSIDLLRGLVMALMALDHTRDFFAAGSMNPRDFAEPAVFLTRWVTHFCAPTFILLAGVSAHLHGARGRSTQEISRFLLTRGLWLILIELTLVRFAWRFNFDLKVVVFQVIWVIGASMVVLAGLVHLPRWIIAVVGLGVILGHNLLDGIRAEHFVTAGWVWGWAWSFLHQPALLRGGSWAAYPLYSLLPWVGVMALGYAMGPIMQLEQARRRRLLLALGAGVCVGFVLLRASNLYGDPVAWTAQDGWLATALSFIDCQKYPASLLYLMMTLGPAMMALAAVEGARGRLAGWATTIGRVPLLYYVLHLYLIHGLAVLFATITLGDSSWLFAGSPLHKPADYGLPLSGVYAVWLCVVIALYPVCRRFAALKQNRREWWWSYM